MTGVYLDEADQAVHDFRNALKKFEDYIEYVKTIPHGKRTMKQKELIAKFGKEKKRQRAINLLG